LGLQPALRDRKTGKEEGDIHGEASSPWTKFTAIDELGYRGPYKIIFRTYN